MSQPTDRPQTPRDSAVEDAAQDWLISVTDPDASEAQLAAFQDWYRADARHRAAYDEQKELWEALGDFEPAFSPDNPVRKKYRKWQLSLGGLAAACIALFAIQNLSITQVTPYLTILR